MVCCTDCNSRIFPDAQCRDQSDDDRDGGGEAGHAEVNGENTRTGEYEEERATNTFLYFRITADLHFW